MSKLTTTQSRVWCWVVGARLTNRHQLVAQCRDDAGAGSHSTGARSSVLQRTDGGQLVVSGGEVQHAERSTTQRTSV